jgi:type I restriction enzyme S subunit
MKRAWPTVRLSEVLSQRKAFITIDDLANYKRPRVQLHVQGIILRDEIPGALIKTKQQQVCRAGEFLVAEIDAKVGGFGIVPPDLDGAIVSSHYFIFVVDERKLDRRFLGYFIQTPRFRDQIAAQGSTNYAAIRASHVLTYEMPLPQLEEQQRIVTRIEEVAAQLNEAQKLRQEAVSETEAMQTSVMRKMFAGCSGEIVELEEVCLAIIDNLHSNPRYAESGIPCIRSPDVGYGALNLEGALRTDEEEYKRRIVRGAPQPDDIVLVREGGGTGKCALVLRSHKFSLGQRVMMLRPNTERVVPRFFLYQLLSPLVQDDQILALSKGSASPHLNIGALRRFAFRLPALDEQHQIVAGLNAFDTEADALKELQTDTAGELEALMPTILDRAFTGGL